jgi:transcriptional accessory protein Tex/SPT6
MKLPGIVTNVTNFGAFVDVGVHQDGLVHISELSDRFVKSPADVVSVQQQVTVTVMAVDLPRKRIALSMKSEPGKKPAPKTRPDHPRKKRSTGKRPTIKAGIQTSIAGTLQQPLCRRISQDIRQVKRFFHDRRGSAGPKQQRQHRANLWLAAIGPGINVLLGWPPAIHKAMPATWPPK